MNIQIFSLALTSLKPFERWIEKVLKVEEKVIVDRYKWIMV